MKLEDGVDFGAAGSEVGGGESDEDKHQLGESKGVVVVVEEDADRDVQQDADHHTHDERLQHLVIGQQVQVAQRTQRGHDGKDGQQQERLPEAVAVVDKEAD